MKRNSSAKHFLGKLGDADFDIDAYLPSQLKGSIFVGHLVTDMDSIAGAIGAAELYGGVAARASEVNSETAFCLDYWGMAAPQPIEVLQEQEPDSGICLVDHQQMSQLNKSINLDRIVGVIDHHALQNSTIVTDRPIYIDIRPWGSMSSIIAHNFFQHKRKPRKCVAGMLLCAILSDTLNLMGPTTTDWDRTMAALLCKIAEVDDVNFLASMQFKAKSRELSGLTSMQLVNGDKKTFSFKTPMFENTIGFAVIETTDDDIILDRKDELLMSMTEHKEREKLGGLFLAVVNIVSLRSNLLLCSDMERSLACESFQGPDIVLSDDNRVLSLGSLVSRKNDFIPPLTRCIKNGFKY